MCHKESGFHHDLKELERVDLSAYTIKPFLYQRLRLHEFFASMKNNVEIELVKYWLDIILKNSAVTSQLQRFNVIIPDQLMPRNTTVSKVTSIIAKQFLTLTIKESHKRKGTVLSSSFVLSKKPSHLKEIMYYLLLSTVVESLQVSS